MCSKRQETVQKKLAVLEVIKNKKVLFGNFSTVTSSEKEKAQSVLATAQSFGLATESRSWTFARDTLYGVWKSRALAKRDNARKTGSEGGVDKKYDDVDQAIFDIIEKDSAILDGLGLPESDGSSKNPTPAIITLAPETSQPTTDNKKVHHSFENEKKRKLPKGEVKKQSGEEKSALEVENKRLKNKLLEIEIYKQTLEALKLERELGLPPSEYT